MNCLIVHNTYQTPGGEDVIARQEAALLRSRGHTVREYWRDNREIGGGAGELIRVAVGTVWSASGYRTLAGLLREERFDVAHFYNTFPLISPSAYYACRRAGVPVVQTVQNYRLLCPAYAFYREGRVCEACLGRAVPWPAVAHGCYRGSRTASATVAAMVSTHRALGTWRRMVDAYVVPTRFAKEKFVEGGLPADRIEVKPNFLEPDPGTGAHDGGYALFVGRLPPEKGVRTLIEAWRALDGAVPLKVAGGGGEGEVRPEPLPGVEWLGPCTREQVSALMKEAAFLVFPSEWYEGLPMTLLEAFASGLPVVASRLGAMLEVVEDGRTGLHFTAGDAADLAAKTRRMAEDPEARAAMGRRARAAYETRYRAAHNYDQLEAIYRRAAARAAGGTASGGRWSGPGGPMVDTARGRSRLDAETKER